ncbi:hypothetical protein CEXT_233291 [Caerostris extrusa]|uniref:Uncharacterized protein n=1 Tax=Caerostris extrusa TaxID=172846 RepID=A0AAV4WRW7_CAEEX|nr:hypothetical protein CEXT_233291 [Caerostris extrusa]
MLPEGEPSHTSSGVRFGTCFEVLVDLGKLAPTENPNILLPLIKNQSMEDISLRELIFEHSKVINVYPCPGFFAVRPITPTGEKVD